VATKGSLQAQVEAGATKGSLRLPLQDFRCRGQISRCYDMALVPPNKKSPGDVANALIECPELALAGAGAHRAREQTTIQPTHPGGERGGGGNPP
jgi:hypothetical protein